MKLHTKNGFIYLKIEPEEDSLDFVGPGIVPQNYRDVDLSDPGMARTLRGVVKFNLAKATKIRDMSIKFKGHSQINLQEPIHGAASYPLLPKLKAPLEKMSLLAGEHVVPWEIDIPNIYPRTLSTRHAKISYQVIVSINTGLTLRSPITAEHPIEIRRHLLPIKELALCVETKIHSRPDFHNFHYEIDAPQIVCIEQGHVPMLVKYTTTFENQKLQAITTKLIQIEVYRRQPSKSNALFIDKESMDIEQKHKYTHSNDKENTETIEGRPPAFIHKVQDQTNAWSKPFLIQQKLDSGLWHAFDSPQIKIYHELEITFQFGKKHEEIKCRLPIIIASFPKVERSLLVQNSAAQLEKMKYAFEEVAGLHFLEYRMEAPTSDYYSPENSSMMPPTHDDNNKEGNAPSTTISNVDSQPNLRSRGIKNNQGEFSIDHATPNNTDLLKKSMSASELIRSGKNELKHEEKPRTTTPTMKRNQVKNALAPINVDLANKKLRVQLPQTLPPQPPPPQAELPPLPPARSVKIVTSVTERTTSLPELPVRLDRPAVTNDNNTSTNVFVDCKSVYSDDTQSIRSELSISSADAPSLSSSTSFSTSKSQPVLHSRPASPACSPADNLPAVTQLRPKEIQTSQIEETFASEPEIRSPAMNTIASSTLLSPCTSNVLRKKYTLSQVSLFTNDSLQYYPSAISTPRGVFYPPSGSSDLQLHRLLHRNSDNNNFYGTPLSPTSRYLHAKLPPVPHKAGVTSRENKRTTRLYVDDSEDEEENDILQNLSEVPPIPSSPEQDKYEPPRLPRLSFGDDFQISLDL